MSKQKAAAGVAVVAAAVFVAGCGSTDDAESADSSAAPASGSSTAQSLVLAGDQFPDGFEALDVDAAQAIELAKAADSSSGEVKPAACGKAAVLPEGASADSVAVAAAMKSTAGTLIESVAPTTLTIADFTAAVTGKCATVTTTLGSGPMAGLKARVTNKVLEVPKGLAADDAIVYQQDAVSTSSGQKSKTQSLTGVAVVDGHAVRVQYSPLAPDAKADRSAFDETFAAAVKKAAGKN